MLVKVIEIKQKALSIQTIRAKENSYFQIQYYRCMEQLIYL